VSLACAPSILEYADMSAYSTGFAGTNF